MNQSLQTILDFLQQNEHLTTEAKNELLKAVKKVNSDLEISEFKLERTEKVKRTTAILLEETIEELEKKRKAVEAQNRELEIESALERVRTVAMGMNKADELLSICETLFNELQKLGFNELRNSMINIHDDEKESFLNYDFSDFAGAVIANVNYNIYHSVQTLVKQARSSKDAFIEYVYSGKELADWKKFRKQNGEYDDPRVENITSLYYYFYSIGIGSIGISTFGAIGAEKLELLKRFRNVFDLAYRRYIDITKAEAQAREAQIEAALERVRSRTMSMQRSDELAETAAVLFNQLVLLGIEPNRLYIGIIKDDNGHIEFWATDEEGSKVSTQFIGDAGRNASLKKMYDAWKAEKKSLTIDMQGKELSDYFHYLADELKVPFTKGLSQKRRIQTMAIFGKGFLGIASPEEQPKETAHLLERFAAVFNLTYTRFNDLKIAEAHAIQAEEDLIKLHTEKQRAEDALNELQATQKQLIQSEKMASLGELTAGIAHEIQNPLNFVNNFSEVSKELLEEMKDEMDNGNMDDAKDIAGDVIQNLEKILHHGKRADGIVKGMLQHSRSSSGVKELTDINALTDEYFRLAYHGLRAKDKTFNAAMKTDYDESLSAGEAGIGLINILPQDIGRVILNLITNAFYAVNEKKKSGIEGYEPTVSVSTKKLNGKVEIKVSDNGSGIPQKVLDKIFQPFFTTKPTGQGTGLGLSLSYDIVKAHGGEIKVETLSAEAAAQPGKEREGTAFIISIPN